MNRSGSIKRYIASLIFLSFLFMGFSKISFAATNNKKRDPFVALVRSDGKIKTWDELFPSVEKKAIKVNVSLKAIIWDEKRPLAFINNKIYSKGQEIQKGIVLENISPNSITLKEGDVTTTILLRKTEKKAQKWIK